MTSLVRRIPSASEYRELRASVGWKVPDLGQIERSLAQTTVALCADDDSRIVGMGRVVGDGAFYLFVVDLVVTPEYQGQGLGSLLLRTLEHEAARVSATGILHLIADGDVVPFYETHGYGVSGSQVLTKKSS